MPRAEGDRPGALRKQGMSGRGRNPVTPTRQRGSNPVGQKTPHLLAAGPHSTGTARGCRRESGFGGE